MLVGNVLLKDLMVIVMSDLKYLLMFLSVTSKNQKEYLVFVNTIAKLLMGDKFGYDAGSEYSDIVAFKANAKKVYKDGLKKPGTTLKPLKKQNLRVLKGGKNNIDQK
tara:strand:- start:4094 stop:4414 length:321 start_codon:yes stop_codon:yes gene_type:complete